MSKLLNATLPDEMLAKKEIIEKHIERYLPDTEKYPEVLHAAIRYSVLAGGKRLRPLLALVAYESCGGESDKIYKAAVAVEFIHTYSLIHDDLPCMDNDNLRRGIPTLHKKYGEAVALLAGDALHDLAFNLIGRTNRADAVSELAQAIGTGGMLAGQMADMEAEGRELTLDEVSFIHSHKTGMLIRAAIRIGAVLASADSQKMDAVTRYGEKIGLAFQIIDDILDIEGDEEKLGKPIGSDKKNLKATYPAIIGMESSRKIASDLVAEAIEIIDRVFPDPEDFISIARFIAGRQN